MLKRKVFGSLLVAVALSIGLGAGVARAQEVRKDVPYVPTPEPVVEQMLDLVKINENDVVYDLGCGDGRIVIAAVQRGAKKGIGVDIDPQRIKESNENAERAGVTDKVKFINEDLFKMDFEDATVLTMYLLPSVNLRLRPKILDDMKPGSRVVSHAFDMDEWQPDEEVTVEPGGQTVYFWTVPAKVDGKWDVKLKTQQGEQQAKLDLKQEFQKVSGTATVDGKEVEIRDAKLKGDELTFALADQPDMRYTAKIDGNQMQGTAKNNNGGEAQIAGSRQGPDPQQQEQQGEQRQQQE